MLKPHRAVSDYIRNKAILWKETQVQLKRTKKIEFQILRKANCQIIRKQGPFLMGPRHTVTQLVRWWRAHVPRMWQVLFKGQICRWNPKNMYIKETISGIIDELEEAESDCLQNWQPMWRGWLIMRKPRVLDVIGKKGTWESCVGYFGAISSKFWK